MLRSRICVPPLVIYTWGDDTGCVTDRHISHYRALANGGAGLVIQEATAVCREGRLTLDQLGIWEDGQVSGLRRIADTLHAADMPAIVQLSHAGLMGAVPEYRVSPSGFQYEADGELRTGRALDAEEISTIEQCFIDGARRASEAGFDGVELHASHGYLLSEFMNTAVNRRSDAYGADGLLILKNIIEGIRGVTPPGFLLGVRMGAFEPDLAAGIRNAKQLEAWGVDFLDVFYGCDWVAQLETPAGYPFNASIYGAKCIKQAVQLPVFAVNQIRTGEHGGGRQGLAGQLCVGERRQSRPRPRALPGLRGMPLEGCAGKLPGQAAVPEEESITRKTAAGLYRRLFFIDREHKLQWVG